MRSPLAAGMSEEAPFAPHETLRETPPLIKGHWRLGAEFSRDAVVDRKFGVTD